MYLEMAAIILLVSFSCVTLGIFLVLKQKTMLIDSISHTVLLGIVVGYLLTENLNSPILIIGAALVGVLTVFLTQLLENTNLVKKDAAIGLVFPLLFSLGIIILTKSVRNTTLDVNSVLLGKIEFSIFDRFTSANYDFGPKAIWIMSLVLLINVIFTILYYKELKLTSFDPMLAFMLGFSPTLVEYLLMTLVSITTVASFQSVGSMLVISFMVGPAVISYFLNEDMKSLIIYSYVFSAINSFLGLLIAMKLDLTISGTIASVMGLSFILIFFLSPKKGVIGKIMEKRRKKEEFMEVNILFHINRHNDIGEAETECNINTMNDHLKLEKPVFDKYIKKLIDKGYVFVDDEILRMKDRGRSLVKKYERELLRT